MDPAASVMDATSKKTSGLTTSLHKHFRVKGHNKKRGSRVLDLGVKNTTNIKISTVLKWPSALIQGGMSDGDQSSVCFL